MSDENKTQDSTGSDSSRCYRAAAAIGALANHFDEIKDVAAKCDSPDLDQVSAGAQLALAKFTKTIEEAVFDLAVPVWGVLPTEVKLACASAVENHNEARQFSSSR